MSNEPDQDPLPEGSQHISEVAPNLDPGLRMNDFIRNSLRPVKPLPGWTCTICGDSTIQDPHTNGPVCITCGHVFHKNCITLWLCGIAPNRNKCPNCRYTLCALDTLTLAQEADRRASEQTLNSYLPGYDNGPYLWLIQVIDTLFHEVGQPSVHWDFVHSVNTIIDDYHVRYGGTFLCPEHEQEGDIWLRFILVSRIRQHLLEDGTPQMPNVDALIAEYLSLEGRLVRHEPRSLPNLRSLGVLDEDGSQNGHRQSPNEHASPSPRRRLRPGLRNMGTAFEITAPWRRVTPRTRSGRDRTPSPTRMRSRLFRRSQSPADIHHDLVEQLMRPARRRFSGTPQRRQPVRRRPTPYERPEPVSPGRSPSPDQRSRSLPPRMRPSPRQTLFTEPPQRVEVPSGEASEEASESAGRCPSNSSEGIGNNAAFNINGTVWLVGCNIYLNQGGQD